MNARAVAGVAPTSGVASVDKIKAAVALGLIILATALTNVGLAIITSRLTQTATAAKNIGWGTSTTAAAVADTALGAEAAPTTGGGRTVGTESVVTTSVTNDTYQVAGTVTATAALAITEAGLFDAVSAGRMLLHSVFSAINVAVNDSIAFTFKLVQQASVT